tara:strand:- start:811 stop:1239 length:429 start_codon:yes stop_codon:yes gene_type:complete
MATEDIEEILTQLKSCNQVDINYNFKVGDKIKYITIKDGKELFYVGGNFEKYGNEKIFLSNGGKTWCFKTKVRDDENNIIYNSKIFLQKSNAYKNENNKELINTIKSQQEIIDKMAHIMKRKDNDIKKYEETIEKLRNIKKN